MAEGTGTNNGTGRTACIIQYDGTNFVGWQLQKDGRSVQGVVEEALRVLTREKVRVTASGRTDSGVHAVGQVIHFNLSEDVPLKKICIGMNGILPHDVSVRNAFRVGDNFNSRFSAVEREYRYYIYNYPQRSPFSRYRAMWVHEPIDVEYIREVASHLTGMFDFSSFCKKRETRDKRMVRSLSGITVSRNGNSIEIIFRGRSFLHNTVRIMVGTILDMHKNGEDPSAILKIIERKDREQSGVTAPPYGLYLYHVSYDPPLSSMESAFPDS